jgi:hypothetical protein
LAKQFGEGSSRGGPLRNFLDKRMQTLNTLTPRRLTIAVRFWFLVYGAFRSIVAH